MRGTYGLWDNYPAYKNNRVLLEDVLNAQFFKNNPGPFWYLYGDLFNKLSIAEPHEGFRDLQQILEDKNYHIYHEGIDDQFQKAQFPEDKIC